MNREKAVRARAVGAAGRFWYLPPAAITDLTDERKPGDRLPAPSARGMSICEEPTIPEPIAGA